MAWNSIDDVIKELKLNSSPNDFEGLKRELQEIVVELHPDKTGGSFTSEDNKQKYYKVSDALDYVSNLSKDSQALMPITALPAIIKAIREAQLAPVQTQISQLRKEVREDSRMNFRSSHALPRIGSGVFASICLGLFTFSSALQEHPVLGLIFNNIASQITLLVLAVYAGIFFAFTWIRERQQEALVDYLISEDGRYEIFNKEFFPRGHQFSLRDVLERLKSISRQRHRRSPSTSLAPVLLGRPNIQPSVLEKIVNMHLLELENRGVIHRLDIPSMDLLYQVDDSSEH